MINENELIIANKSYTNKDFASIYPELLELAKKLTNKWDPSSSNESDPGVVLLKLLAFIGDKTVYNIDKNILEAFMPSATQESSMRKLSEMNGYEMGYFNSATVDVTFMYKGLMENVDGSFTINLPSYSTVITGTDSASTYILLDRVQLIQRGVSVTKKAIEGTLQYLRGTDNSFIQLTNIDDSNRLYFPERFVAVNGIFITNTDELNNLWTRVDNLNTQLPLTKCFKFGFDSIKNLPYVEFPKDIATLIGNGLDIKYVITQGSNGNIKANFLNKLYNTTNLNDFITWGTSGAQASLTASISDLVIANDSASIDGRNPESIDEAYNSFKKVVGTFDTLVSCRDYANFIYRLTDNYLVSNVQVADRRTDINYSNNLITFDQLGAHFVSNEDRTKITPFDIVVYPLNNINDNYDNLSYYNSFRRKTSSLSTLEQSLEEVKTISHDLMMPATNDVFLYKNYYILNANITTVNKVTAAESKSVVDNVKSALYRKFNAREIDYGYEIPFDTILQTIQQADTRIKNVSLGEPELITKVLKVDSNQTEVDYTEVSLNSSEHQRLLAKNILAGRVSLFDYYEDFEFEFYQSARAGVTPVIDDLDSMSTEVSISSTSLTNGYTLKENEVIQLVGPSLTTKITYPAYVNFNYSGTTVTAGTEYQLKSEETIKIVYTDTNDVEQNIQYQSGDIIKVNFTLESTATSSRAKIIKKFGGINTEMNTLGSKETIEIRDFVKTTLNNVWKCYWILDDRKNPSNTLFTTTKYTDILLTEGESFMYTDSAMTELVILGSGTRISLTNQPINNDEWTKSRTNLISREKINDKGLAAFSAVDWKEYNFAQNNMLIEEMSIYTFGKDVTVKISDIESGKTVINNTFITIPNTATIEYKESGSSTYVQVPQFIVPSILWNVRSRLDLNTGPFLAQKIEENQTIKFIDKDDILTEVTKESGKTTVFKLNTPLCRSGGEIIDLRVFSYGNQQINITYDVTAFVYNDGSVGATLQRNNETGLIVYEIKSYTTALSIPVVSVAGKDSIIMFYWNKPAEEASQVTSITVTSDAGTVSKYNQSGSNGELLPGLNVLKLSGNITTLTITIAGTGTLSSTPDTLVIGKMSVINGLNFSRFGWTSASTSLTESLLSDISTLATKKIGEVDRDIFLYNASLDSSHLIEVEDLSTPYALFDYNNIANQFTLAEIDVDGSSITIARSSKL